MHQTCNISNDYHLGSSSFYVDMEKIVCVLIARAASQLEAYDNAYLPEFSITSVLRWDHDVIEKISSGETVKNITPALKNSPTKYVDMIECKHPGYLHSLYQR